MINTTNYIENISNTVSSILFYMFIAVISILALVLILSLFFLIIGCLIKSQTIKSKFLKASISILILLLFIIAIPYVILAFKNFI